MINSCWVKCSHADHVKSESCVKDIGAAWRPLIVLVIKETLLLLCIEKCKINRIFKKATFLLYQCMFFKWFLDIL